MSLFLVPDLGAPQDKNFDEKHRSFAFFDKSKDDYGDEEGLDDDDIFTILIVSVSCFKLWQTLCFATDWSSHCHTHGDDDDKGVVGDGV